MLIQINSFSCIQEYIVWNYLQCSVKFFTCDRSIFVQIEMYEEVLRMEGNYI